MHLSVRLSIALVHGLEDGGERALESGENEDATHHHEDEVDAFEAGPCAHVAVPHRGHGRHYEVEGQNVFFQGGQQLYLRCEPSFSVVWNFLRANYEPKAGKNMLDVHDQCEKADEPFHTRVDLQ